jgi:hypothetical protein
MADSTVSPAFINRSFIEKIEAGLDKEAAVSATSFVRDVLREEGFTRKIFTPQELSDDQLDKDVDDDKPMKIIEKEPDSKAMYVSFRGLPESKYFTGKRFAVFFAKIQSEKYTKSIFELKTYDNDIRKIISDNSVRDVQTAEDGKWISTVNAIVLANPAEQDIPLSGGVSKINLAESLKFLAKLKRPTGCMLMNDVTSKELLKWDSVDIGDAAVTDQYYKGLTVGTIHGIKALFTIKRELVPDDVIYFFSTEDFLGKFFILQDATVYIKHEADMLEFFVYESIGIGVGNTKSVIRVTYT